MKKIENDDPGVAHLDRLIEEITTNDYGNDEQLRAFRQAFEDSISVPCDGFVIGEPVSVVALEYDGNERRGLTARCRRDDGSEHVVAASEVVFPPHTNPARYLAAYRKWLGLEPFPREAAPSSRPRRQHKVTAADLDPSGPIELAVLSVKENAARCRLLGSDRVITLRARQLWALVPGEIAVVNQRKQWSYAGHPYLSGEIESTRLDVAALDLVPLKLEDRGTWTPEDHYWGAEDEPIEEWAQMIIARGPRPAFEIEQVLPGRDPDDFDSDPICEANELKDAGDLDAAYRILMALCQADLRCLDAHAHLGNFVFDHRPQDAIRHYEIGLRVGEQALGSNFDGLLPWGYINNRPFLRCLHGFGLCLWRLGRFEEAGRVFERMLWLNPADDLGVRFVIAEVRSKTAWEDRREEG
jgi:tetratricopeptide (TPR) repeat protein